MGISNFDRQRENNQTQILHQRYLGPTPVKKQNLESTDSLNDRLGDKSISVHDVDEGTSTSKPPTQFDSSFKRTMVQPRRKPTQGRFLHQATIRGSSATRKKEAVSENELCAFITRALREIQAFQHPDQPDQYALKPKTEAVFRQMAGDFTNQMRTVKLEKVALQNFLKKRYSGKIAKKIVSQFNWLMPMNCNNFYRQVQELFFNPYASEGEMIEQARQFSFSFYDVNSDSAVDFNDLFTFLREISSEQALINAAYRDINDLQVWLKLS